MMNLSIFILISFLSINVAVFANTANDFIRDYFKYKKAVSVVGISCNTEEKGNRTLLFTL